MWLNLSTHIYKYSDGEMHTIEMYGSLISLMQLVFTCTIFLYF